jgi:surface polysaccharide O-acyltransferase-like enzyme
MRALSRSADADIAHSEGGSTTATIPDKPRPRPARLPQIDVMRLLICASVVATHVVSNANPMQSVPANAAVNVLHYTRQAFFFISALVLVHVHWSDVRPDGRVVSKPGALRRRVSVLGMPYLLWSTFYAVLGLVTAYSWGATVHLPWTWFVGLLQGTDGYHMYFLLVSVEFALIFPLFLKLLHATRGHHLALLVGSGALELATMALFHYVYQPEGWWRAVAGESSLTAYQFWLVAGGLAAIHFRAFHGWVTRHRALVVASLVGVCVAATGLYFGDVRGGELPEFAGRSLQPVTVPLSIAAIGTFYLLSLWIAGRSWAGRLIGSGTYLSFGIYLSHPAILTGLLYVQHALPRAVSRHAVSVTLAICVLDFALSVVVAALLSRTRWSTALIGRPRRHRPAPVPRRAAAAAAGEAVPAPGEPPAVPLPPGTRAADRPVPVAEPAIELPLPAERPAAATS